MKSKQYRLTKLQSRQTGQAGLRFKQLLCGRPHWGAWRKKLKKQFDLDGINENAEEKAARAKGVSAHLSKYNKIEAELVLPGEIVGYVGASGKKDGKYDLNAWKNPHLHITYYDIQYTNDLIIECDEIYFKNKTKTMLINQRRNPFIHNSETK